jgi:hypothetical protein
MIDLDDMLRPILWIARALWWLAWDFMVHTIGWSIGWYIWRGLTFGRFPEADLKEMEQASFWVSVLVELTGLAALGGAIALLMWRLSA